ncbi:MAG: nitroreductase [Bacteroidetes bacterium]|nr:nitroreductase [Bacteroidota bacterium]
MTKDFYTTVEQRRSYYGIGKEAVVSDEKIKEIIEHAVKYTPSAFNSQSARVILLLGAQHNKLWSMTKEILRKIVPAENFGATEEKINSFGNGYGTVLFFEDNNVIDALQNQYPPYAHNFPVWSQQSNGMHQFVVWSSLEAEGFGASLQHYTELIEEEVKKEWHVAASWKLIAQMPFGKPTFEPDEKPFQPLKERVLIYK